jgi:hypothetical protein
VGAAVAGVPPGEYHRRDACQIRVPVDKSTRRFLGPVLMLGGAFALIIAMDIAWRRYFPFMSAPIYRIGDQATSVAIVLGIMGCGLLASGLLIFRRVRPD